MRPWRPPRELEYRSGPWKGQRQHVATAADRPNYAELLLNLYIRDPDTSPVAVGRPGFALVGAGGTPQLGSAGVRTGQLVYNFTTQAGTDHRIAIVGGKFYTYDFGTDTFTETLSAANLSGASITLSTTARCHAVTFNNKVIISDGVNTPWAWDGTSGGGLTKLTNAPVFYGQPWVYYNRLWAIKGTSTATRISVTWSEPGTPNTGYEAGSYLNVWDVAQTSQAIFYAGAATNDSMVLCRANSATRITGEVSDNFSSTANREGVHEFVGTLSPSGMLVHQDVVYYFSNDGRIMRVRPGGAADEIAPGAREYMARQSSSKFDKVEAMVWDAGSSGEYLLWAFPGPANTQPSQVLVVDPRNTELVGVWEGWVQERWGVWKDSNGVPRLVHIGGSTATASNDGYVYLHGQPTGSTWNDEFQGGDQSIGQTVQTHAMGWDTRVDKYWDECSVSVLLPDNITDMSVAAATPYGDSTTVRTGALTGGGAKFDIDVFDTGVLGADAAERVQQVGLDAHGRWASVAVSHRTADEQWAVQAVGVTAVPVTDAPVVA